jgi:hypothetical protein
LESCYKEIEALIPDDYWQSWAKGLFCCRVRQMRPQQPVLKNVPEKIKPLFEVFPERED